mgnify:CR=1 FL=1
MKETLTFRAKEADQEIKSDAGKWRITLVPPQIIFDIAEIRGKKIQGPGKLETGGKGAVC